MREKISCESLNTDTSTWKDAIGDKAFSNLNDLFLFQRIPYNNDIDWYIVVTLYF